MRIRSQQNAPHQNLPQYGQRNQKNTLQKDEHFNTINDMNRHKKHTTDLQSVDVNDPLQFLQDLKMRLEMNDDDDDVEEGLYKTNYKTLYNQNKKLESALKEVNNVNSKRVYKGINDSLIRQKLIDYSTKYGMDKNQKAQQQLSQRNSISSDTLRATRKNLDSLDKISKEQETQSYSTKKKKEYSSPDYPPEQSQSQTPSNIMIKNNKTQTQKLNHPTYAEQQKYKQKSINKLPNFGSKNDAQRKSTLDEIILRVNESDRGNIQDQHNPAFIPQTQSNKQYQNQLDHKDKTIKDQIKIIESLKICVNQKIITKQRNQISQTDQEFILSTQIEDLQCLLQEKQTTISSFMNNLKGGNEKNIVEENEVLYFIGVLNQYASEIISILQPTQEDLNQIFQDDGFQDSYGFYEVVQKLEVLKNIIEGKFPKNQQQTRIQTFGEGNSNYNEEENTIQQYINKLEQDVQRLNSLNESLQQHNGLMCDQINQLQFDFNNKEQKYEQLLEFKQRDYDDTQERFQAIIQKMIHDDEQNDFKFNQQIEEMNKQLDEARSEMIKFQLKEKKKKEINTKDLSVSQKFQQPEISIDSKVSNQFYTEQIYDLEQQLRKNYVEIQQYTSQLDEANSKTMEQTTIIDDLEGALKKMQEQNKNLCKEIELVSLQRIDDTKNLNLQVENLESQLQIITQKFTIEVDQNKKHQEDFQKLQIYSIMLRQTSFKSKGKQEENLRQELQKKILRYEQQIQENTLRIRENEDNNVKQQISQQQEFNLKENQEVALKSQLELTYLGDQIQKLEDQSKIYQNQINQKQEIYQALMNRFENLEQQQIETQQINSSLNHQNENLKQQEISQTLLRDKAQLEHIIYIQTQDHQKNELSLAHQNIIQLNKERQQFIDGIQAEEIQQQALQNEILKQLQWNNDLETQIQVLKDSLDDINQNKFNEQLDKKDSLEQIRDATKQINDYQELNEKIQKQIQGLQEDSSQRELNQKLDKENFQNQILGATEEKYNLEEQNKDLQQQIINLQKNLKQVEENKKTVEQDLHNQILEVTSNIKNLQDLNLQLQQTTFDLKEGSKQKENQKCQEEQGFQDQLQIALSETTIFQEENKKLQNQVQVMQEQLIQQDLNTKQNQMDLQNQVLSDDVRTSNLKAQNEELEKQAQVMKQDQVKLEQNETQLLDATTKIQNLEEINQQLQIQVQELKEKLNHQEQNNVNDQEILKDQIMNTTTQNEKLCKQVQEMKENSTKKELNNSQNQKDIQDQNLNADARIKNLQEQNQNLQKQIEDLYENQTRKEQNNDKDLREQQDQQMKATVQITNLLDQNEKYQIIIQDFQENQIQIEKNQKQDQQDFQNRFLDATIQIDNFKQQNQELQKQIQDLTEKQPRDEIQTSNESQYTQDEEVSHTLWYEQDQVWKGRVEELMTEIMKHRKTIEVLEQDIINCNKKLVVSQKELQQKSIEVDMWKMNATVLEQQVVQKKK